MVKAEFGDKRECTQCDARFYDLNRTRPACPACGAVHQVIDAKPKGDPAAGKPAAAPAKAAVYKPKTIEKDDAAAAGDDDNLDEHDIEVEDVEGDEAFAAAGSDDSESLIEDDDDQDDMQSFIKGRGNVAVGDKGDDDG